MCWDSGGWQNLQAEGIQLSCQASGRQKWHVSTKKDHRGPNSLLATEQPSSQRRGFCGRLSRTFCEVLWITLDFLNILWITLDLEVGFVFPEKEPEIPTTLCKKNKRLFNHDLEPHSFPLLLFQRVTFRRPDTFMATVDSTLFPQRAKCKPSTWTYE